MPLTVYTSVIDLDDLCDISGIAKACCSYTGPRHSACKGKSSPPKRGYRLDAPCAEILPVRKPLRGIGYVWDPYGDGSNTELDNRAGHLHINRRPCRAQIEKAVRSCPQLYLISVAPSQRSALDQCRDFLADHNIGAHTLRYHFS